MDSGLKVLENWYHRVWKEADVSAIHDLFPSGPARGLDLKDAMGPEEFKEFHQKLYGLMSDIEVSIDKGMEDAPWICALCTLKGKSRADGREVSMQGQVMGKMVNGKIEECYNHWDFIGLYVQLGLLPPDLFSRCLCGEKMLVHNHFH
jgi:hypothetical protein